MTHGELPNAKDEWKNKVLHLSLLAGGVNFLMSDSLFEQLNPGNAISQSLTFETEAEAHDAFDKLAAGGIVKDSLKPAFWGALFGMLEDKYGIMWMITTEAKES